MTEEVQFSDAPKVAGGLKRRLLSFFRTANRPKVNILSKTVRRVAKPSDRDLIAARDASFKVEASAVEELRDRIDGYLPPNYRSRKMIDHLEGFAKSGGYNNEAEYYNFRYACEETRLQSNRVFSWVLADHSRIQKVDMAGTMFGGILKQRSAKIIRLNGEDDAEVPKDLWDNAIDDAYRHIEAYGYWKLPVLAPPALVKSLKAKVEAQLKPIQQEVEQTIAGNEGAKLAHWVNTNQACTFKELYQLAADPFLYSIAQKYLGLPPIFNTPVSVLSGPVKTKADKEMEGTGQLYHYDMHRLKFVKMFIYLTDVDEGSGPHTLIKGTHRKRPELLWTDRRYSDAEMAECGAKNDEVSITGRAGTVFFVDTSAYHKGAHPEKAYRIMAQVQYTNSLFGKPIRPIEHKIELAKRRQSGTLEKTISLVRKYAGLRGARFMQNYI
ncbi:phytanoyl-CoA dioxygenase family protein [Kumtagia ephedrae]|nr:phytanoyl-CoA dioxygenase family protein [Mesorhizobium ephedrae]